MLGIFSSAFRTATRSGERATDWRLDPRENPRRGPVSDNSARAREAGRTRRAMGRTGLL